MADHDDRRMIAGFPWPERQVLGDAIARADRCVELGLLRPAHGCGWQSYILTDAGLADR